MILSFQLSPIFVFALTVSALAVYFTNTDHLIDHLSPLVRVGLIVSLAIGGKMLGQQAGMNGSSKRNPLVVGLLAAGAVAILCAGCDFAFRSRLTPDYLTMMTKLPLLPRMVLFSGRALVQGFIYRVFVAGVLMAVATRFVKPSLLVAVGCFSAAWTLNVLVNSGAGVFAFHDPLDALYVFGRFILPGICFGMVYNRFGIDANECAASTVHLMFQPLATVALVA